MMTAEFIVRSRWDEVGQFDTRKDALAYLYMRCKEKRPKKKNAFMLFRKDGAHIGHAVYNYDKDLTYYHDEYTGILFEFDKHGELIYTLDEDLKRVLPVIRYRRKK